ncbi:MAG: signal peptide peptidase SppA, partial [Candidatus Muiribacteriaceae bacterium]
WKLGEISNPGAHSIGLIEIDGAISFSAEGMFQKQSIAEKIISDLDFFKKSDVKVVILRVNSPGGSIGAVQEICDAMVRFRENDKKIVASFKDISASGGYYVSCFADKIIANPGTLTGSIGVIMTLPNFAGLFDKLGINYTVVKSGKYKDIGNLGREMTTDEKELLQSSVDDSFQQFVDAVVSGRKLERENVLEIADGRLFTGRQAKQAGLVDELGGFQKAVEVAKKLADIKGRHNIVRPGVKNNLMELLNELSY